MSSGIQRLKSMLTSSPIPISLSHSFWRLTLLGLVWKQSSHNSPQMGLLVPLLTPACHYERNYGITELVVVWAVRHFRPYLYGHQCEVFTDHVALKSMPQSSGKLTRWDGHPGAGFEDLTSGGKAQRECRCIVQVSSTRLM